MYIHLFPAISLNDAGFSLLQISDTLQAVSYTHLDVYKRQILSCKNLTRNSSCFLHASQSFILFSSDPQASNSGPPIHFEASYQSCFYNFRYFSKNLHKHKGTCFFYPQGLLRFPGRISQVPLLCLCKVFKT